ncbi:hypothetical protein EDC04DRAFT_2558902, partial [Pisolithus marmoratus]
YRSVQDLLVHHGCHFGHVMHAFCNVQALLTNGITLMVSFWDVDVDDACTRERREYSVYRELLKVALKLEECVTSPSEEAIITIMELIQKSGARADDTKSMKAAIIDWITPKGQTLIPHIPRNVKTIRGIFMI